MLAHLTHLPLGPVEFHESVGSTNDLAADRLAAGAPDRTLILADEQTAGRGRRGRIWHTPPGTALAFSLVLRPPPTAPTWAFTPLGALAVHDSLAGLGLESAIKWPNDVLVNGKKACGILVEAHWQGSERLGIILGIGLNVLPGSYPPEELNFPATSIGESLGGPVDRGELLAKILEQLLAWLPRVGAAGFAGEWESRLAYRGQEVAVGEQRGILIGLNAEGSLLLQTDSGMFAIPAGEISLRPSE